MHGRPKRIIWLVIYGIIVGLWNIFAGVSEKSNTVFLEIGSICIFLSFGIFMLWNWARLLAFIFSFLFIAMYIMLVISAMTGAFQGFAGIAAIFHFPLLILSLLLIDNLRRKEIKAYFKKKQQT